MRVAVYSNIGGRPVNEDTVKYVQNENGNLCLVVADGLGGHGGGRIASRTAAETICGGWTGSMETEELTALVQRAHQEILQRQTSACLMKSTVVMLTLSEKKAAWIHAGDSRLYHFLDGRLIFQTKDHSASQIAVALGQITPAQIRFHEDRSRVLKALGQEGVLSPENGEVNLLSGRHAFLLCTDGFWEYVLEQEMEEDLREASDPQDWIVRMRDRHALKAPPDNDNNSAAAAWIEVQRAD